MDDKTLHGAKLQDILANLEKHSEYCEEKSKNNQDLGRQRFYEGMSIAYKTIAVTLKDNYEPVDHKVIDALYDALEKNTIPK